MVKKLIKHEFIYYIRTFIIILPVMLFSGITTRIIQFFESDTIPYTVGFTSSLTILYFSSIICIFMSVLLGIIRFYKNMYSSEGYLTFTLPVSYPSHIIAKLIAFLSCQVVSLLILLISWLIAFSGISSVWDVINNIINTIFSNGSVGHIVLMILELVIFMFVGIISNGLLYYACISVGQLAKKNRILLAIVAYYVYYVALQVLISILMVVLISISETVSFENLKLFITNNPFTFLHILLWIMIVICGAFAYLFYSITLHIMKNKLNLE